MDIDQEGIDFIKSFENCKLKAYKDPGSKNGLPITIGFGSTMFKDGSKIKLGDNITQKQAEELFDWEIEKKTTVLKAQNLVLNQNQFNALSSFIYNDVVSAFNTSTLLKKIKINPKDPLIKAQFMRWINNDGKVSNGLKKRRTAEVAMYFQQ
jgi:lysozyme